MILFVLKCTADHRFEAWFRNGDAYETQAAAGSITCPVCGDTRIAKAPMAPRIARNRSSDRDAAIEAPPAAPQGSAPAVPSPTAPPPGALPPGAPPPGAMVPGAMVPAMGGQPPAQAEEARQRFAAEMMRQLSEMRKTVEENCDYVGERFAEEARRIHYGETDPRGIYGEASAEDVEELREEGVTFHRIPWLPRTNS